jgi:5-amino-6-(5-phosphoribosylamino)uracil reductase
MKSPSERFTELVARKTAAAERAVLAPFGTDFDRHEDGLLALGNDWSRRMFDGPFYMSPETSELPSTSLVFVQSRDGNTGAADPGSLGAGDTDKHLIYEGLSRVAADGVLAGAETVRGGDVVFSTWHPEIVHLRESIGLPRHPVQIVATLRGLAFDETLLYNVPELRVVVVTVAGYAREMEKEFAARPWITPLVMHGASDLPSAFAELEKMGVHRISAIGGRTLARSLIDCGLVRDLYLTTAPRDGGDPDTPLYPKPLPGTVIVRKHGTGREAGVVFEQWRLKSGE